MKKFSTRLFSLLAVFCLVFSFSSFSFASDSVVKSSFISFYNSDIAIKCTSSVPVKYFYLTVNGANYDWFVAASFDSNFSSTYSYKFSDSSNFKDYVTDSVVYSYNPKNLNYTYFRSGPKSNGTFTVTSGFLNNIGSFNTLDDGLKYIVSNFDSFNSSVLPSLDSGLGSFVLGSNNAWANRVYGNNEYHGSFMTILRDTTTTGKKWGTDFDTLQYYTGVDHFTKLRVIGNNEDLGSFMSDSISVASDSQLTNGRGGHHFTVSCPEDFRKPMASALESAGAGSTFDEIYNNISAFFTQLINNNSYSFKPVVVVRPYNSKTGAYGNWLRVTSGTISKPTLNSSQSGSSLIGSSSDDSKDPTIKEPTGSVENKGVVSSGDTLENAINNSYSIAPITNLDPSIVNNNYPDFYNQPDFQNSPTFSNNPNIVVTQSGIQSQSGVVSGGNNSVVINNDNNVSNNLENINQAIQGDSSGNDVKGSVLSNIFGLLGMITAVPKMLSVLFGWLPSWALTCAGVAFALILPLIIYKIIRG